jgi:hypothetical protein
MVIQDEPIHFYPGPCFCWQECVAGIVRKRWIISNNPMAVVTSLLMVQVFIDDLFSQLLEWVWTNGYWPIHRNLMSTTMLSARPPVALLRQNAQQSHRSPNLVLARNRLLSIIRKRMSTYRTDCSVMTAHNIWVYMASLHHYGSSSARYPPSFDRCKSLKGKALWFIHLNVSTFDFLLAGVSVDGVKYLTTCTHFK